MASAVSGWRREQEQLAKEAADLATPALNEWVGSVEDKLTQIPATVVSRKYLPGDRFSSTLITMRDGQGRTLKWFASNPPDVEGGVRSSSTRPRSRPWTSTRAPSRPSSPGRRSPRSRHLGSLPRVVDNLL